MSSFLLNTQNNNNDNSDNEKKNINRPNNKYVYKKEVPKSFSCVNLKEKIKNEREMISKSKRNSKIIKLNSNNEFTSSSKKYHKGGIIDLNFNKTSHFQIMSERHRNKEMTFKNIYSDYINLIIKIQRKYKIFIKLKKIKYIQKQLRKYWHEKYSYNRSKCMNDYYNNNIQVRPIINKCENITKIYKSKNQGLVEKIIFIQKKFIQYSIYKKNVIKKEINKNCSISKVSKNRNINNKIILLQRKIKEFIRGKKIIRNKKISYYEKFCNVNNIETPSSVNPNKYINSNQYKNSIPISTRSRNRDLCNIESFNNSTFSNIANEFESNNKKIINKDESINSLYLNYQNIRQQKLMKYQDKNKNNNKIIQSQEINYNITNEKTHHLPKKSISKLSKYINNNSTDRYIMKYQQMS